MPGCVRTTRRGSRPSKVEQVKQVEQLEGGMIDLNKLPAAWPASALVVDSDPQARWDIARLLGAYRVESAASIYEAVPLIRCPRTLHLAFVEFELVDGCGFALLRELDQFQPHAARVLVSGLKPIRRFIATIPAHVLVSKPLDATEIGIIARARLGEVA